jgi:hypothetical protein
VFIAHKGLRQVPLFPGRIKVGEEVPQMARAYGLRAKLQFTYVLDVDGSVGKNGANRHDDVMLVQYMLSVWMAHEKDPKLGPMLVANNVPVLKVDGICGDKTKAVIDFFELFHQPFLNRDGRIDPMTPASKKQFLLNQILFFAGGLRGGVPETRIPFPDALRPLLYR